MGILNKPLIKGHKASLVSHIFQTILITYLVLLLAEQIWKGFVSSYLNLNYLLVLVIILGVLDLFSEHSIVQSKKPDYKDYFLIFLLGIAGFIIIKIKTAQLGGLSWLISVIAGVLIVLLSILILNDEDSEENQMEMRKND